MDLGRSIRRRRAQRQAAKLRQKTTPDTALNDDQKSIFGRRRRGGQRLAPKLPRRILPRTAGLVAAVVVGGFGLGYIIATTVFFPVPQAAGNAFQAVPDLRGVTLNSALTLLAEFGLGVDQIDSIHHPVVPEGTVIGQSHLPGRTVLPGGKVRIAVSSGPAVAQVPDVTRLRSDRAAVVLEAGGFTVQSDTVESSEAAGHILGLEPLPGTEVSLPTEVRLLISSGPPTLEMPDLNGTTVEEATALLDSLGLVLSRMEVRLSLRQAGLIMEQEPQAGEEIEVGSEVRLVLGQDPMGRGR